MPLLACACVYHACHRSHAPAFDEEEDFVGSAGGRVSPQRHETRSPMSSPRPDYGGGMGMGEEMDMGGGMRGDDGMMEGMGGMGEGGRTQMVMHQSPDKYTRSLQVRVQCASRTCTCTCACVCVYTIAVVYKFFFDVKSRAPHGYSCMYIHAPHACTIR